MQRRTERLLIERRDLRDGRFYFVTRTKRRPWLVPFDADAVPPFEGPSAWCDVACYGRPWRVLGLSADQTSG